MNFLKKNNEDVFQLKNRVRRTQNYPRCLKYIKELEIQCKISMIIYCKAVIRVILFSALVLFYVYVKFCVWALVYCSNAWGVVD